MGLKPPEAEECEYCARGFQQDLCGIEAHMSATSRLRYASFQQDLCGIEALTLGVSSFE